MESVSVDRQQRSIYYLNLLLAEKSPIMESQSRDIFFFAKSSQFYPHILCFSINEEVFRVSQS